MKAIFLILLSAIGLLWAQHKPYFQQEVHYTIQVTLDPPTKTYQGSEQLIYKNNSADSLPFLRLHLYPNAYKNNHTPFARQMEKQNRSSFYFSKAEEHGFLNLNRISCEDRPLEIHSKENAPDEVKIILPHPLAPGDSCTLHMKFNGRFPRLFSRMGYFGKNYFAVTQWYPKAVVYDRYGWHPDSYLDQGEFYGEYGTFDVSITLPQAYVIDATGMLQDNSREKAFIKGIVDTTRYFLSLKSKKERRRFIKEWKTYKKKQLDFKKTKTVRFIAKNVHNFAWFCGLNYLILQKYHNHHILTNVLVTPDNAYGWRHVPEYVEKTVRFYGKHVGPYQYPKASVVDGALKAGGGMEYPMITIISIPNWEWTNMLEDVVMHEVGHNWFMGMLGSNERASTFLDEGMNSFLEYKYMNYYHGFYNFTDFKKLFHGHDLFHDIGEWQILNIMYGSKVSSRTDQPLNLTAGAYTSSNYSAINYQKGVTMLLALEWYLGEDTFWKGMHTYFKRWNGHHPYIGDFFQTMSDVSDKDLSWFVNDWYNSTKYNDFEIEKVRTKKVQDGFITRVYIENEGTMKDMPAPVYLETNTGDTLVKRWAADPAKPVVFTHEAAAEHIEVNLKRSVFETNYLNDSNGFPDIRFHLLPQLSSFTAYDITFFPYYWFEPFKDKHRIGLNYWSGNPILQQWFARGSAYYSSGSQTIGYSLALTNRYHFAFCNYSDMTAEIHDKSGLKRISFSTVNQFLKRDDDHRSTKLTVGGDLTKLYDLEYSDPHIFQEGEYASLFLSIDHAHSGFLKRWTTSASLEKGIKVGNFDQGDYFKLSLESTFSRVLSEFTYVKLHGFAASIWGRRIPSQEALFAAGFVDPKHKKFTLARNGRWALLHHFSFGRGMHMFGYTDYKNPFFKGQSGASVSLDLKIAKYMPTLYLSAAGLASRPQDVDRMGYFAETGFKLNLGFFKAVFPVYITDPAPGEKHLSFRFVIQMHSSIRISF